MTFGDRQRLLWAFYVFGRICDWARPDLDWIGWVTLATISLIILDLWRHRPHRPEPQIRYSRGWRP